MKKVIERMTTDPKILAEIDKMNEMLQSMSILDPEVIKQSQLIDALLGGKVMNVSKEDIKRYEQKEAAERKKQEEIHRKHTQNHPQYKQKLECKSDYDDDFLTFGKANQILNMVEEMLCAGRLTEEFAKVIENEYNKVITEVDEPLRDKDFDSLD